MRSSDNQSSQDEISSPGVHGGATGKESSCCAKDAPAPQKASDSAKAVSDSSSKAASEETSAHSGGPVSPTKDFLAVLRARAPGKEGSSAAGGLKGSSGSKQKKGSAKTKKQGPRGDVPTVLLAVGSAYITGRLLNALMRAARGRGGPPLPGSPGMERELARLQHQLETLRVSEQDHRKEKVAWLKAKSAMQEEAAMSENRHAETLSKMEATLQSALERNNSEWGEKLKVVKDEANTKLAQVQAWQEELEKLRSEASQIRTLIEQVRSRSNSPAGRGRAQSPFSTGKENSLMASST